MTASPIHRDAAAEATHRLIRDALTASDLDPAALSPEGASELHLLPQVLPHLHLPPGLIAKWIADGEDIEATDRAGRTPLHYATQYGRNADLVNALLAAGADTHARDEDGQIPLHRAAAFSENVEVLAALLKSGAAHDARDDRNRTPLHLAARDGHLGAVTALLAAGADLDARDEDGATPFHLAVARNAAAEVLAAMVSAGDSVLYGQRDKWGRNPMAYCRSIQTFVAGITGEFQDEPESNAIDIFRWWRRASEIWTRLTRLALILGWATLLFWLIYLPVAWPVSWLAYWLVEDPLWRYPVTVLVPLMVTIPCLAWILLRWGFGVPAKDEGVLK